MSDDHPLGQADDLKACCATFYEHDLVALLLGASYHPGGATLTRRLAELAGIGEGTEVLDVASGTGATGVLLASEFGARVDGVDLGANNVAVANTAATDRGLSATVRFQVGDAEALSVEDASMDVVITECAFCTFPDKARAASEFLRVLRPGGRLVLSDVVVNPDRLDEELRDAAAWIACIADARTPEGYASLLTAAGFTQLRSERHDDAVATMLEQIDARLQVLRMTRAAALGGVDVPRVRDLLGRATAHARAGDLGYVAITAERPS